MPHGATILVSLFGFYLLLHSRGIDAEVARFAGFTALVTSHLGLALRTVRSFGSEASYPRVVWFIIAMAFLVLAAAALIPAFSTVLHFEPMSLGLWVTSLRSALGWRPNWWGWSGASTHHTQREQAQQQQSPGELSATYCQSRFDLVGYYVSDSCAKSAARPSVSFLPSAAERPSSASLRCSALISDRKVALSRGLLATTRSLRYRSIFLAGIQPSIIVSCLMAINITH